MVDWYFRRQRILLACEGGLHDEGRLEIWIFEDWKSEQKSPTTSAHHKYCSTKKTLTAHARATGPPGGHPCSKGFSRHVIGSRQASVFETLLLGVINAKNINVNSFVRVHINDKAFNLEP
ncbi:hypothetical protein QTP88_016363 [Uroleucon formosanum]